MSHSPTVHPQLPTVGLLWANLDIRWCPRCSMSPAYVYVWRLTFTPMLCPQQTDFPSPWRWPSALKKTTRRWLTSRLMRSSRTLNTLNESAALTPLTFHHTWAEGSVHRAGSSSFSFLRLHMWYWFLPAPQSHFLIDLLLKHVTDCGHAFVQGPGFSPCSPLALLLTVWIPAFVYRLTDERLMLEVKLL